MNHATLLLHMTRAWAQGDVAHLASSNERQHTALRWCNANAAPCRPCQPYAVVDRVV